MFQNREKDFQHPWIPILSLFCAPLLKKTGCLKNRTSPPNDARFRRAEFTFCNWRRELLTRRALGTRLLVFAHFHWTRRDRKRPSVIGLLSFGVRILRTIAAATIGTLGWLCEARINRIESKRTGLDRAPQHFDQTLKTGILYNCDVPFAVMQFICPTTLIIESIPREDIYRKHRYTQHTSLD